MLRHRPPATPVERRAAAPRSWAGSRLSQSSLHRETAAESSFDRSGSPEAAQVVEAFRVRIADHVEDARGTPARDLGTMIDQQSSTPCFQSVGSTKSASNSHCRPPRETAAKPTITRRAPLRYVAIVDVFARQRNRVRIRE